MDPTWFLQRTDVPTKLRERMEAKGLADDPRYGPAIEAVEQYLALGGRLVWGDLTPELLGRTLAQGMPILTGTNGTYLYQCMRETDAGPDDIRGEVERGRQLPAEAAVHLLPAHQAASSSSITSAAERIGRGLDFTQRLCIAFSAIGASCSRFTPTSRKVAGWPMARISPATASAALPPSLPLPGLISRSWGTSV